MNCQDISRILDEQDVDGLRSADRPEVQKHLAACRDCARDWQIHAQLAGDEIPAVPAELRAHYAKQMAAGQNGGGRRSRFIVIGAVVAFAAAAAMMVTQMKESTPPVAAAVDPPQFEATVVQESSEVPVEVADPMPEQPKPRAEQIPVVASAGPTAIRVLLLPPRHSSPDVAARPAIEAFHSSMLQALRRIPDVTVEVAGEASATDQSENRFTVISPQYTTLTSGQRVYQAGDGRGSWTGGESRADAQVWAVEVMLERAIQGTGNSNSSGARYTGTLAVRLGIDSSGNPLREFCNSSGIGFGAGRAVDLKEMLAACSSVDQLAARLVDTLLQKPEPPASGTEQLSARLRDASLPATDRQRALSELVNRVRQGSVMLDAAALDAITAYVGSLPPDERAQSWLRLRGLKLPILVAPLLDALRRDLDEKVRLEALSALVGDYGSDNRVRAALEAVARQDSSRLVRMAAQWPLSGDAQWHRFVLETLADNGLPAPQRLAPALYSLRTAVDRAAQERTMAFMGSAEVTRHLLDIFDDLRAEVRADGAQNSLRSRDQVMNGVLNIVSSTNPAAALELQIKMLEDPLPNSVTTDMALRTLIAKRDDPRVSKVLDDIAAGKAGPELRNSLERTTVELQQFSAPRSR